MNTKELKKWFGFVVLLSSLLLVGCGEKSNIATHTHDETTEYNTEAFSNSEAPVGSEVTYPDHFECEPASDGSGLREDGKLPRLFVQDTALVDEWGNPIQLTGVSSHGVQWYPQYLSAETMATLHYNWGANVFRIAMYTAENGYCEVDDAGKENFRNLISDCVDAATVNNMYVIIDWHILRDGDPNTHKEEAKEFFTYFAEKYADNTNVIYEICNEPNNVSWDSVKSYAEEIIPVIRSYDSKAVILVGTPMWSGDLDSVKNNRITIDDNLMYSFHFYAQSHQDAPNKLTRAFDSGLPVFVTEYGLCDYNGSGQNDFDAATRWLEVRSKYHISSCMWSLGNKNETCCLIQSWCDKNSAWNDDELKEQALWLKKVIADEM